MFETLKVQQDSQRNLESSQQQSIDAAIAQLKATNPSLN